MYRKIFAFLARPQRLGFSIGINLLLRCSKWPTQSETPTGPQNCLGENSVKTSQLSTGANILSGNPKSATHVHSRSSAVHGFGVSLFWTTSISMHTVMKRTGRNSNPTAFKAFHCGRHWLTLQPFTYYHVASPVWVRPTFLPIICQSSLCENHNNLTNPNLKEPINNKFHLISEPWFPNFYTTHVVTWPVLRWPWACRSWLSPGGSGASSLWGPILWYYLRPSSSHSSSSSSSSRSWSSSSSSASTLSVYLPETQIQ